MATCCPDRGATGSPRAAPERRRPGAAEILRPTFRKALWNTYDNLGRLVVANLLWIGLCLPVVTAPAATAALFDLARRAAAGRALSLADFARAFRRHFLAALGLSIFDLAAALLLWVNVDFYGHLGGRATVPGFLLAGVMIWAAAFWILMHAHLMPLLVEGERRLPTLLRKAALLTLDNVGYTLGVTIQAAALSAICLLTGAGFLLAGGSLVAALLETGHRELQKKYHPPAPGEDDPPETRGFRDLVRPWDSSGRRA